MTAIATQTQTTQIKSTAPKLPKHTADILAEMGISPDAKEVAKAKAGLKRKKIEVVLMTITPEFAAQCLSRNINSYNRPVQISHARRLADAIKGGEWQITNELPAFDTDGNMLDAQHRFMGVVLSGTSVETYVGLGFDRSIFDVIGQSKTRTVNDVLYLKHAGKYPKSFASIASAMNGGGTTGSDRPSVKGQIENIEAHLEALCWTKKHYPCVAKGLGRAAVPAVIARAWYTVPHAKLDRFCVVLRTGVTGGNKSESSIIRLRDWLAKHNLAGHMASCEAYRKVEYVLYHYLNGAEVKSLYQANEEFFPLPEDADVATT